jgi:DNA repair exonuclease SbcCD ATPase subunit
MIIKSFWLANFRSYGKVPTRINLRTDTGELILLLGKNGGGKSSLIDSLSFGGFGIVNGRNGKRVTLKQLPNRLNDQLQVGFEFMTPELEHGEVVRSLNPSKVKLTENGVLYPKAGKIQDVINSHMGFDFETFKSFISMSINDFKNFIELGADDKKILLDKLFNMEVITKLQKIVKEMRKLNNEEAQRMKSNIDVISRNISSVEASIQKYAETKSLELGAQIEACKQMLLEHKAEYMQLSSQVNSFDDDIKKYAEEVKNSTVKEAELRMTAKNTIDKIKLYEMGQCPTCHSSLSGDEHLAALAAMKQTLEELKIAFAEQKANTQSSQEYLDKYKSLKQSADNTFNKLKAHLEGIKYKQTTLRNQQLEIEQQSDKSYDSLNESIDELSNNKTKIESELTTTVGKDLLFKTLIGLFSDEGIKKKVVKNIIRPLNIFIKENLDTINMSHSVVLDDSFDASLKYLGKEIGQETLSTGEAKKINMCVMLAYIKLLRTKKHINVLFLDEVFASIDEDGVKDVLTLLKKFAQDYKVNVFLVHHSDLPLSKFDRILKITKGVFSTIEEYRPNGQDIEV